MKSKSSLAATGFWLLAGLALLTRSSWNGSVSASVSPSPDSWAAKNLRIQTSFASLALLQDPSDPFEPYDPQPGGPVSVGPGPGGPTYCSIEPAGGNTCSATNYKNCSAQGSGYRCSSQPAGGGAGERYCSAGDNSTTPNQCSATDTGTCSTAGGGPEGSSYECSAWGNAKCSAKSKAGCSTSGTGSNQKCTSHQANSKCSVFSGQGGPPTQCTTDNGNGGGSGFCSAEGGSPAGGQCSTENTPGGTWSGPDANGRCRASDP